MAVKCTLNTNTTNNTDTHPTLLMQCNNLLVTTVCLQSTEYVTNVKLSVVDSHPGYFHLPTNALNLLNNKQQTCRQVC